MTNQTPPRTENRRKGRVGRRVEDPLIRARRAVYRSFRDFEETEALFKSLTGLDEDEMMTERGQAVMAVAYERLEVAERLEAAKEKVKEHRRAVYELERAGADERSIKLAKKAMKDAKAEELRIQAQLNELPDLGATHQEWADTPDELKVKPIGRPALPIEIKYLRAQNALAEATQEMHALEDAAGLPLTPPEKVEDPDNGQVVGRPRADELTLLDRELRRAQRKLEEILAEDDSEREVKKSASGVRLGRKPMSKQAKARRWRERISELKQVIAEREAELDDVSRKRRELRRKRTEASRLRAIISNMESPETSPEQASLEMVEKEIRQLDAQIKAMESGGKPIMGENRRRRYAPVSEQLGEDPRTATLEYQKAMQERLRQAVSGSQEAS